MVLHFSESKRTHAPPIVFRPPTRASTSWTCPNTRTTSLCTKCCCWPVVNVPKDLRLRRMRRILGFLRKKLLIFVIQSISLILKYVLLMPLTKNFVIKDFYFIVDFFANCCIFAYFCWSLQKTFD